MTAQDRTSLDRFILSHVPSNTRPGELAQREIFWRDRYKWLLEQGYQLRSRYTPDWKPSWEGTKKSYRSCEDGLRLLHGSILDAVRQNDGTVVVLKRTTKSVHPDETKVGQYFSSPPVSLDPRNHCVPIYDVLQDPLDEDICILVMPFLRTFDEPRFNTIGEALDFFRQIIEGMSFMHENHVAHRDCSVLNIMMEPNMYPELYHPVQITRKRDLSGWAKHYSRTERPVKYYFVDFGLSKKYNPEDGVPLELPIRGGDKSVPESQGEAYNRPSNPFAVDVYCLGNLIRESFLKRYRNLQFMDQLVADMVQEDPSKRPNMEEVLRRFNDVQRQQTWWKLRAMLVRRDNPSFLVSLKIIRHVFRTTGYVLRRLPPQPTARN